MPAVSISGRPESVTLGRVFQGGDEYCIATRFFKGCWIAWRCYGNKGLTFIED
jgi:hypothetical protein